MAPRFLILVSPARRTTTTIKEPAVWDGQACAACGKRIERDPAVYLVEEELRCGLCVYKPKGVHPCVWCGLQDSPVRDTGDRFCRPHWAMYVAWVADAVESPAFRALMAETRAIVQDARGGADAAPKGEDRPSGERHA